MSRSLFFPARFSMLMAVLAGSTFSGRGRRHGLPHRRSLVRRVWAGFRAAHGYLARTRRKTEMTLEPTAGWSITRASCHPLARTRCGQRQRRNAFWLAARGLTTLAVDRSPSSIAEIRATASQLHLPLRAEVVDLEVEGAALPFPRSTSWSSCTTCTARCFLR